MQTISVYLYPNKLTAYTNLGEWTTARYRRVYNRNLKVFRGVDNRVDLQVLNADEKKKDVTGKYLVFNIVTRDGNDLILSKDFTEVDIASGKLYVTLTQDDLYGIETGSYNYAVVSEERTYQDDQTKYTVSSRTPMYIDSQYGAVSTLEVHGDVYGDVTDSLVVNKFELRDPAVTGYQGLKFYISSLIDTKYIDTVNSQHTFQYYFTNYSGTVTIQGSISDSAAPRADRFWVDLDTQTFTNETMAYTNVVGKYNWFRIKHTPTSSNTGTVDKVLFR